MTNVCSFHLFCCTLLQSPDYVCVCLLRLFVRNIQVPAGLIAPLKSTTIIKKNIFVLSNKYDNKSRTKMRIFITLEKWCEIVIELFCSAFTAFDWSVINPVEYTDRSGRLCLHCDLNTTKPHFWLLSFPQFEHILSVFVPQLSQQKLIIGQKNDICLGFMFLQQNDGQFPVIQLVGMLRGIASGMR